MLARGPDEFALFQKIDAEEEWPVPMTRDEIPGWLRFGHDDMAAAVAVSNKQPKNLDAEIAALTGVVLHHAHHDHGAGAAKPAAPKPPAVKGDVKSLPRIRIMAPKAAAAAAQAAELSGATASGGAAANNGAAPGADAPMGPKRVPSQGLSLQLQSESVADEEADEVRGRCFGSALIKMAFSRVDIMVKHINSLSRATSDVM